MTVMNDREIWRIVPSVPGVLASSHGRVMRIPTFSRQPNGGLRQRGGVPTFGVWDKKNLRFGWRVLGKNFKVHRLICEAFNGAPPTPDHIVLHRDEDASHNRPGNLKWGTQVENAAAPKLSEFRQHLRNAALTHERSRVNRPSPQPREAR